ncbi:hypothetical protein SsS58_06913 [Streptomyces scabiei]|uniref:Uncharacterized protein n=1 Tax=Streptomyces scabiei TaxID=1930 RepID=A0A100JVJ1_STRSC|nr:hypothetical protein SsS58_06913 [Streptomyces scabiei]
MYCLGLVPAVLPTAARPPQRRGLAGLGKERLVPVPVVPDISRRPVTMVPIPSPDGEVGASSKIQSPSGCRCRLNRSAARFTSGATRRLNREPTMRILRKGDIILA